MGGCYPKHSIRIVYSDVFTYTFTPKLPRFSSYIGFCPEFLCLLCPSDDIFTCRNEYYSTPMVNIWDRNDRPIQSHTCSDRFFCMVKLHGSFNQKCFTTQTKTGDWNLQHDSQKTFGFFFGNWYNPTLVGNRFVENSWQKGPKALRNLFWLMRKF